MRSDLPNLSRLNFKSFWKLNTGGEGRKLRIEGIVTAGRLLLCQRKWSREIQRRMRGGR